MACCLVGLLGCCLMGKEVKRGLRREGDLPPEWAPDNDAVWEDKDRGKRARKALDKQNRSLGSTKSPAVQEAIARRSALQRSGGSDRRRSSGGSGKRQR